MTINPGSRREWDYIVIGGGTAGCVMAARLTERPGTTVLLLEAGGEYARIFSVPLAGLRRTTADEAKSVIVGGILAQPLLWAAVLVAAGLAGRSRPEALRVAAAGVLAIGAAFQVARLSVSHQINISTQHRSGPKTAIIQ